MNAALQQEITGRPPQLVSLGGREYPLDFSFHAVILYKQLTGDNLFDGDCWKKIAPLEDPERFIACLWAGLHKYDDAGETWIVPFTRAQLERMIDFANVTPAVNAVALALASYFPKAEEKAQGESPLLPAAATSSSEESESPNSGPLPVSICG
jgi:hypothetical protein